MVESGLLLRSKLRNNIVTIWYFDNYHYLSSVTFAKESQLKQIYKQAFQSTGLVSFEAPLSLVALGKEAFYSFHELTSVIFSSEFHVSPRFIGDRCFRTCGYQLARAELPDTVSLFNKDAFDISCFVTMRSNAKLIRALDNEDSPSLQAVLSNVMRTNGFLNAQELEGYLGSLDWK